MTVGAELAAARERLGLSLEDLSKQTKIGIERLAAIEREDIANLPPLVYLKGFIREYATAVHADPDETVRRYVGQLDEPVTLIPLDPDDGDLFRPESDLTLESEPSASPPLRLLSGPSLLGADDIPEAPGNLADAASRHTVRDNLEISAPIGRSPRLVRMAIGGLIAVIAGFLVSANYGQWLNRRGDAPAAIARPASDAKPGAPVAASQSGSATATPRDEVARASTEAEVAPPAPSSPPAPSTLPRADSPAPPAPPARPAPAPSAAPSASDRSDSASELRRDKPTLPAPPASSGSLTGAWSLTTRIETSDVEEFRNMNLGYRLQLQQDGDRITGRGMKWMENGKVIPERSRTPILIEGLRYGDRLELQFTERGARRVSGGMFVMDVAPDGTLRGQFESNAANSSGISLARRASASDR
jgi:cytoskeleton protein RodZ